MAGRRAKRGWNGEMTKRGRERERRRDIAMEKEREKKKRSARGGEMGRRDERGGRTKT